MAKPYIIVLGNEKGGSGKTTTAMHLIFSLIYRNHSVSTLDLDLRQLSLDRYLENRKLYYSQNPSVEKLLMPEMLKLPIDITHSSNDEKIENYLNNLFEEIKTDFIVIDTPGSSNLLSQIIHSFADLIITPINDSFIDMDLIATIKCNDIKQMKPSLYSTMIWEQKIRKFKRDRKKIEWIVIRNRLSNLDSNNRRSIDKTINHLSKTLAFRLGSGFSERIIYRELFPFGLTLLDILENQAIIKITASHIAARQELRNFINDLKLPNIKTENIMHDNLLQDKILELRNKININ